MRLGVVFAAATVGAAALGLAAGTATYATLDPGSQAEGFESLGAALVGFAAGFLVATATFVATTVIGVRWALPPGWRLRPALVMLAAVPIGVGVWIEAERWAAAAGIGWIGLVGLVAAVAGAAALVGATAGVLRWPRAGLVLAAAAGVLVAGYVVAEVQGPRVAHQRAIERYERADAPLALWRGRQAEGPVPGWLVNYFPWPRDGTAAIAYRMPGPNDPGRTVSFTLTMERSPELQRCEDPATRHAPCLRVGSRRDGDPMWGNPTNSPSSDLPLNLRPDLDDPPPARSGSAVSAVWVDVPDGRWTLHSIGPLPLEMSDVVDFLEELRPVDVETFVSAHDEWYP
ncbi:MAG: hypothetical protein JJU45_04810 [Acidimicrobiia bacterium]|nr:hypothetical protein [Acidimicrobiia bacterium]